MLGRGGLFWSKRLACQPRHHPLLCGIAFVHLVATVGMLLALQGWKSRLVNFDLVPHVMSAHDFLRHGQLPDRGCLAVLLLPISLRAQPGSFCRASLF